MTYHGTNTYLIETETGHIVLDPGPNDDSHLHDILRATAGKVSIILLSHTHSDHLGSTTALKSRTGAVTAGFHLSADPAFSPDTLLHHGDVIAGMTVLHTPGHSSDHLCFARPDGIVFSGDHIMSWSSSIVSPPDGNMAAYLRSLRTMLLRNDRVFLPGHGPPLPSPKLYVKDLLDHRVRREREILARLIDCPHSTWDLVDQMYATADPWLRHAAERNVAAHLLKLQAEGLATQIGECWQARKGAAVVVDDLNDGR
jgi:glyoxylase-like metal-dependent hydrolase (beta-lactamase superfamily II)